MAYDRDERRYGYERNPEYGYRRADGGRREGGQRDGARERDYGAGGDRGFFERAGDEVRSWFGDDDAERRRRADERFDDRDGRGYVRQDARGPRDTGSQGYGQFSRSNRDDDYRGDRFSTERAYGAAFDQSASGRQFGDDDGRGYGSQPGGYAPDRARERAYRAAYEQQDGGNGDRGGFQADHDHYRSWRDRQLEGFDRDYDEYRRENRTRFEAEFAEWRRSRQQKRDLLTQVKEHQEVVGSDGEHVGTVDHVRSDHILLTKNDRDAGGHHHAIPLSWIANVADAVTLSKTAQDAKREWRDAEERGGLFGGGDGTRAAESQRGATRTLSGDY